MKINNKRVIFPVNVLYFLLMALVVISLFAMYFGIKGPLPVYQHWMGLLFALVSFFILKRRGHQHFEYDSDGEVLNFTTHDIFLHKKVGEHKKNAEFPKKKLLSYKIKKKLFKRELFLNITSRQKGTKLLKFDISYLNSMEDNSLKRSLRKVIEANKLKLHG